MGVKIMGDDLPKKILRIKDFTYILPDNFSGSFEDALKNFLEYNEQKKQSKDSLCDDSADYSSVKTLLSTEDDSKASGAYGIFEFDAELGKYVLVASENREGK
jgi:hypothetical protein